MLNAKPSTSAIALRSADDILKFACMGSAHQHRLSFKRILLRRLKREGWSISKPVWQLDDNGFGTAVYTSKGPHRSYSLVAFSHYLAPDKRTDRVIAEEWDATFALFDGEPDAADIERLRANVVKQEAGRITERELCMGRANKSLRMFDHVVERLAAGQQPDPGLISEVGYLMRTTAVYGSGKFGAADFGSYRSREELAAPYQAEMLTVYLIREFTLDLVEHIARCRCPDSAVGLSTDLRRRFGVGNSTGLGMAPYLVNHPIVLNQWLMVRETALARVRSRPDCSTETEAAFANLLVRTKLGIKNWHTSDAAPTARINQLASDIDRVATRLSKHGMVGPMPWNDFYDWADKALGNEAREFLVSLMIECNGEIVDDLEPLYFADENASLRIDGSRTVASIVQSIRANYSWALHYDFTSDLENARFWYASVEKLEPRLGERRQEAGSDQEFPLAIARDVQELLNALMQEPPECKIALFLLRFPAFRHIARRIQVAETHPYAEIRDNTVGATMRPIDMLRFKLSFFGATRFDPRSDRWVRVTLYQNAPFASELASQDADDWFLPTAS